jgi:hypothetical protein
MRIEDDGWPRAPAGTSAQGGTTESAMRCAPIGVECTADASSLPMRRASFAMHQARLLRQSHRHSRQAQEAPGRFSQCLSDLRRDAQKRRPSPPPDSSRWSAERRAPRAIAFRLCHRALSLKISACAALFRSAIALAILALDLLANCTSSLAGPRTFSEVARENAEIISSITLGTNPHTEEAHELAVSDQAAA